MSTDAEKPDKDPDDNDVDQPDEDADQPEKAADQSEKAAARRRRFKAGKGGAVEVTGKGGLSHLPKYLTEELGLPDWLAGTVVIVAGGLLMTLLVWLLILIFPAG